MRLSRQIIKVSALAAFFVCFFISAPTSAAPVVGFEVGNIIDDAVFTNSGSMSVNQIQQFLNSKVPVCDTWHSGFYGSSGTWYGPPFICLKEYVENGKTSSQIIYDAAQEYKINPQVLIVLLQKEQGLVTDTWPASYQYKTATGYGCPDGAACDEYFFGFTNQVNNAAKMFRRILDDSPTWYTPYELGNNYIQYNPDTGCGGTTVYIQNRSTQALYNYTPYQPNPAALAAGYGYGDYCSAYGNRNFYLYFTDWFGSTKAINGTISYNTEITTNLTSDKVYVGQTITASYSIYNSASYSISAGKFGVCARIDGINYDFGISPQTTIEANKSVTVSFSKTIDRSGNLQLFTCSYSDQLGGWATNYYPYNIKGLERIISITSSDNPLVTTGVILTPSSPSIGQTVTATFTITNASESQVSIGTMALAARDPNGKNVDFDPDTNITIPAESTYTYSKSRILNTVGKYSFYIANFKDSLWNQNYPKSSNTNVIRSGDFTVIDNPLVTTDVSLSPSSPVIGQTTTATFKINNASDSAVNIGTIAIAIRDSNGKNFDFTPDVDVTIPAGSTYTYSKNQIFKDFGKYSFQIVNYRNGLWNSTYPKSSNSLIIRNGSFIIQDNPLVTTDVSLSPSSPVIGQTTTATFKINNASDLAVSIGTVAVAVRDSFGKNYDFAPDINITIPAGSTYTYAKTQTFKDVGKYYFFMTNYKNGLWNSTYPKSSNSLIIRNGSFIIQDNPLITTGVSFSPASPSTGKPITTNFSITNSSDSPVNVGTIVVAARDPDGKNVDFISDINVVIPANSTYTYSKSQTFTKSGKYMFFISNFNGTSWNNSYPSTSNSSIVRAGTLTIQ